MVDAEKITLAPDSPRPTREVFICDPSAEADRLQANLRARGYPVVDVPLGHLSSRIRYEQPDVIVLDAEAPDAESILRETLDASRGELQFVLLGETTGRLTPLSLVFPDKTHAFSRPVDVDQVAQRVANLLGPPLQTPQRSRAPRPPVLMAASRRPVRVDSFSSPSSKSSDLRPTTDVPPALTPSLPPLSTPSGPPTGSVRSRPPLSSNRQAERSFGLSAETRAILEQGRRKIRVNDAAPAQPYRLGPSADAELEPGSPFLEALGAPLETDDDAPVFSPQVRDPMGTEPRLDDPPDIITARPRPELPLLDIQVYGELDEFELEESTNPGGKRLRAQGQEGEPSAKTPAFRPEDLPPSSRDPTGVIFEVPPSAPFAPGPPRITESEPPITIAERKSSQLASKSSGDPPRRTLASTIVARASVVLVQQAARGLRRVVFRDGDLVSVTSSSDLETLVRYLETQSRLAQETAEKLRSTPVSPRQAGAALVAAGFLAHEELLPSLTAYSKWLAIRILQSEDPLVIEADPPQRLLDEPDVFGGRAGAEVFLGILDAALDPEQAYNELGRGSLSLGPGPEKQMISEASLDPKELYRIWKGTELTQLFRSERKGQLVRLAGLVDLGALQTGVPRELAEDELKAHVANEPRVQARAFEERLDARLRLSRAGDYFRILGLDDSATSYEIERARKAIHKEFAREEIPASHAHRVQEIEKLLEVIDEAYRVLKDDERRKRYQRALLRQKRAGSG